MDGLDKLAIARRQLGVALHLFINDLDPISVHCLACGGAEIADSLAEQGDIDCFTAEILKNPGSPDLKSFRKLRAQYWNAFKHATSRDGGVRDDGEFFDRFDDRSNDDILLIGWSDLAALTGKMPISAQVFQTWYLAVHPESVAPDADVSDIRRVWRNISTCERSEQKERLKRVIQDFEKDEDLLNDAKTDRRPLIMPRAI